jgi:hypothetical protein
MIRIVHPVRIPDPDPDFLPIPDPEIKSVLVWGSLKKNHLIYLGHQVTCREVHGLYQRGQRSQR